MASKHKVKARAKAPAKAAPKAKKPVKKAAVKPAAKKKPPASKPVGRPNAPTELLFKPEDFVVYPTHGVGRVTGIETQEISGMKLTLFVVHFEKDKMTLRVPVAKANTVGMRRLSSPDKMRNA